MIKEDLVRLDGYRRQPPATIEVQGFNRGRIALLVVPPDTKPDDAHARLIATAKAGNTDPVFRLLANTHRESRAFASIVAPRWLARRTNSAIGTRASAAPSDRRSLARSQVLV